MKKKNLLMRDSIYIIQKNIFKNNLWIFIIISTIIQSLFIYYSDYGYSCLSFMNGAFITTDYKIHNLMLLFFIFPLYAIFYYFSNSFSDDNFNHEIMLITRNKKRAHFFKKKIYYFYTRLFLILIFQSIIYIPSFFILEKLPEINCIYMIVMYYVVLITLIILQFILEMYIRSNLATTIIIIYLIFSNILNTILENNSIQNNIIKIIFFPTLACGFKNGSFDTTITNNHYSNILIVFLIQIFIVVIGKRKIKKINLGVD